MIAHERFEGNLRLQVPGKVSSESGPSIQKAPALYKDGAYMYACCWTVLCLMLLTVHS